jgi:hypothetical protein
MTEQARARAQWKAEERAFGEWPTRFSRAFSEARRESHEHLKSWRGEYAWGATQENRWTASPEFIHAFARYHRHVAQELQRGDSFQEFRKQFEALQERVSRIEQILEGVDEPSYVDPNLDWCQKNIEKLRQFPDSFVAIDIGRGEIVVHSADQDEFIKKLGDLGRDARSVLFRTHTSQFVTPSD